MLHDHILCRALVTMTVKTQSVALLEFFCSRIGDIFSGIEKCRPFLTTMHSMATATYTCPGRALFVELSERNYSPLTHWERWAALLGARRYRSSALVDDYRLA